MKQNRTLHILYFYLLSAIIYSLFPRGAAALEILFTGAENGQIENCRCPSDPLGSMEKRMNIIDRHRSLDEILFLNGGDFTPELQDTLKSNYLVPILQYARFDAIAVGDQELLQGVGFMKTAVETLPLVCANLAFVNESAPFAPFLEIERDGQYFFITSLLDPKLFDVLPESVRTNFRIQPANVAAQKTLKRARDNQIVILLGHGSDAFLEKLAREFPRVDLVIGAHQETEQVYNGTLRTPRVLSAGAKARNLGAVEIKGNRFRSELIPVRPQYPDDETVLRYFMEYKRAKKQARQ